MNKKKIRDCPRCLLPCYNQIDRKMYLCGTCGWMNDKLANSKIYKMWITGRYV